jgi:hypothetical protein
MGGGYQVRPLGLQQPGGWMGRIHLGTIGPMLIRALPVLALGLCGCGLLQNAISGPSAATEPSAAPTESSDGPAPAEKPALPPLIVGDRPTIPEAFRGVKLGMTRQEVRKLDEKAACTKGKLCGGTSEDRYEDTAFFVTIDDETDRVTYLRATFEEPIRAARADAIRKAWGPPLTGDDLGTGLEAWFDDDAGLRAVLKPERGDLEFSAYRPFAEWFAGDEPLPEAILGKTAEEAAELFGAELLDLSTGSFHLHLAPLKYGDFYTRVDVDLDRRGKIEGYSYGIDLKHYLGSRKAAREVVAARYGAQKQLPPKGECASPTWVVRAKNPRVIMRWDDIGKTWDVRVAKAIFSPCAK